MELLVDVLAAVAIVATAGALGQRVLRRAAPAQDSEDWPAWLVATAALGLGLLSFLVLLVGVAGGLTRGPVLGLLLAVAAFSARELLRWPRDVVALARSLAGQAEGRFDRAVVWAVAAGMGIVLIEATSPLVGVDATHYHLVLPRIYVAHQAIDHVPYYVNRFTFLVGPVHMLYTLALALSSDVGAKLVNYSFYLLAVAGTAVAGRRAGPRTGLFGAAIVALSPTVMSVSSYVHTDVSLAALAVTALASWLTWRGNRKPVWLGLTAALTGLLVAAKPLLGGFGAALLVVLVSVDARRAGTRWGRLAVLALITVLFASPCYLKNIVISGNPLYPFAFGGIDMDAGAMAHQAAYAASIGKEVTPNLIHRLTGRGITVERAASLVFAHGPLLLAFLPLIRLRERRLRPFALFGFGFVAILALTQPNERYLIQALPALAILAASAFVERLEPDRWMGRSGRAAIVVAFTFSLLTAAKGAADFVPMLFGLESRSHVLARWLVDYRLVSRLGARAPEARVFVRCGLDTREYHGPAEMLIADSLTAYSGREPGSFARRVETLRAMGVTHVIDCREELARAGSDVKRLLALGAEKIDENENRVVVRLPPSSAGAGLTPARASGSP